MTKNQIRSLCYGLAFGIMAGCVLIAFAGCAKKTERDLPVTELPNKPRSASLPCERLSDEEIIACIKNPKHRDVCRKLETNCARYDNLKEFVDRTWKARDGK